jgi:hypothetical protein
VWDRGGILWRWWAYRVFPRKWSGSAEKDVETQSHVANGHSRFCDVTGYCPLKDIIEIMQILNGKYRRK